MGKHLLLGVAVAAALTILWVLNCSGPQPRVMQVRLIALPVEAAAYEAEGLYTVEAVIWNSGRGHGEVNVIFRLRSRTTDLTLQESRRVDLGPGETVAVQAQIVAPPDSYEPEVTVYYPPR